MLFLPKDVATLNKNINVEEQYTWAEIEIFRFS